jgi:uncharacterized protein YdaU (DUF1376 family)
VNFYKRFIGDIQAKTGGLTLAQFGAYDRLLDHYYSTENPVPVEECYRICRAMSKDERAAVDAVLGKFFELGPDGYSQSKADEVIAKAQPLIEAARANGKKGGRPAKPKTQQEPNGFNDGGKDGEKSAKKEGGKTDFPPRAQDDGKSSVDPGNNNENNNLGAAQKPAGLFIETQTEPRAKATQSQSQIPTETSSVGKRASAPHRPADVDEQTWVDWVQLRNGHKAKVSETAISEARKEAAKADLSLQRFLEIWCLRGSRGLQADWLKPSERGASKPTGRHAGFKNFDYTEGVTNGIPDA